MKNIKQKTIIAWILILILWGCSCNSQKGQVTGFVTHFTKDGVFWKSWDLEINSSQTGMTSTANEMTLSIDNENEDPEIIKILDSAQRYGWKVQVDYQQNFAVNCCSNRGSSSKFIKKVEIIDKNPLGGITQRDSANKSGKVVDTIYVVIQK